MATTTFDTAWASTEGYTLSNNDRTAADTTRGNQPRWIPVTDGINPVLNYGRCFYLEIEYDVLQDDADFKFGMITENTPVGTDIDSTGDEQEIHAWRLYADNVNQTTATMRKQSGFGYSQTVSADDQAFRDGVNTAGDRIGILMRCGGANARLHTFDITMFKNGQNVGEFHADRFRNNYANTLKMYPAFKSQTTTASTQFTIIEEANWMYKPEMTNVQDWTEAVDTSVTAVDWTDLPCHWEYKPALMNGTGSTSMSTVDFSDRMNRLTVKRWGPDTGSRTIYLMGTKTHGVGKHYFEFYCRDIDDTVRGIVVGVYGKDDSWISGGGSDTIWFDGQWGTGSSWNSVRTPIGAVPYGTVGLTLTDGDYFGMAYDFPENSDSQTSTEEPARLWISKNGTWLSGDPGAGTGGYIVAGSTGKWFQSECPWTLHMTGFNNGTTNNEFEFNFGAQTFNYTIPTGFSAWDDTQWPAGWGTLPAAWT